MVFTAHLNKLVFVGQSVENKRKNKLTTFSVHFGEVLTIQDNVEK